MAKKLWNKKGEAVIDRKGNFHPIDSDEGRTILGETYGKNAENVEDNGSIYDEDGGFYLED